MKAHDFRNCHLLHGEHAERIFAMTDDVGERGHKIGGSTPSISEISEQQRLKNKNEEPVAPNEDE